MATARQKRAIHKVLTENMPVSRAMLAVGYTPNTAKTPSNLTDSDAWRELVERSGISLENVTKVHGKLLQSKREEIAQRAVETAYKVHGVGKDRAQSTNIPILIQIIAPNDPPIDRKNGTV